MKTSFHSIGIRLLALCFLMTCTLIAQSIPERAYSKLKWRLVGPFRAGRSIAAAGIPGNPTTFYMGGVDGGMWKTVNAGLTWEPISDGQMNPSIGAFDIAPSDPNIIYVGTGEADLRSDITYGEGMYKSTDGGNHWTSIGLKDSRHIGRVLIDPRNADVVLVAALGHAYAPNDERGIYRTSDGGRNWKKVLSQSPDVGAIDLASDPTSPSIVYASMYETRRTPWSQYQPNEGPGSGMFKSVDAGSTWKEITGNGLPDKPYGRIGLAVARNTKGAIVYALMGTATRGTGLYRSDDGGQNWRLTSKDPNITSRMWYFAGITVDPNNPDIVYAPNRSLGRSTDGGKTFSVIKGSPGGDDYHFLWIDPTNSERMICASDQGTIISLDFGKTWSSWYNQPTGQFYHVVTDSQFPYRIYGAQQDCGTAGISSRGDYGSITFRDWNPVGAGESGYIAPDPLHPSMIYGGNSGGEVFRFDQVTSQVHVVTPWLLSSFGESRTSQKYRFNWTNPLVFDRLEPSNLYLGSQYVLRTQDGGLHWEQISPDLTRAQGARKSETGDPTIENAAERGWGAIYAISPSPIQKGLIWAGTDDGQIHVTRDGGKHWENVTPSGLKPWSKIGIIDASPFDPGTAYAAVDRHRLDDFAAYIYKTKDFGKHWERADNGIPVGSFVRTVRTDVVKKGLLYAGTETGVVVSFDDGSRWQSLNMNLPTVAVRDLSVHQNDLVAGTHGRAIWILDDLTHLQQLDARIISSEAYLYRPQPAFRMRRSEGHDTPLPPEEPHGTNPPSGAIIDYSIGENIKTPVTLTISDQFGNVVREFSSEDQSPENEPVYFMDEWRPRFEHLTTNAGHNRFVWDLHYTSPPAQRLSYSIAAIAGEGTVGEPQGPLVLPGRYTARLKAGGLEYSQPLDVVLDPRVYVQSSELESQLRLAIDIWNSQADFEALLDAVDSADKFVVSLRQNANTEIQSVVRSLVEGTRAVRTQLRGTNFSGLEVDVMSADRQPTQQMHEAYEILAKKLSEAQEKWAELEGNVLPLLNRQLSASGIPQAKITKSMATHLKVGK